MRSIKQMTGLSWITLLRAVTGLGVEHFQTNFQEASFWYLEMIQ